MANIILVLSKQTKKICIFSNCLTRQFKIILAQMQTITIWMPSTNVIDFTLVLLLKQEIVKYHEILLLWRQFFQVSHIVWRFMKTRLFGMGALIICQLFNQHTRWNLFLLYFILIFKQIHNYPFRQLFFKTFSQKFVFWLKQTFSKNWQFWIVQPTWLKKKIQQQSSLTTAWFAHNQAPQTLR